MRDRWKGTRSSARTNEVGRTDGRRLIGWLGGLAFSLLSSPLACAADVYRKQKGEFRRLIELDDRVKKQNDISVQVSRVQGESLAIKVRAPSQGQHSAVPRVGQGSACSAIRRSGVAKARQR